MPLEAERQFIEEVTAETGALILRHYATPDLQVELKSDDSPVTAADRGAELLLRERITQRFPGHGIIGEEFGNEREGADWVWVLDPIDGTKAFTTAVPLFGTLIALLHQGQPVLGAIHQPVLNQLMVGDNARTTLNGRAVRVRPCAGLASATFLTSDPLNPEKYQNGPAYAATTAKARLVRTWGDCYGYLLLSAGWADVMCDPIMNPWDILALIPVVRGAGGVITDWQGRDPVRGKSIVASANAALHDEVIASLNPRLLA
ncbi:histidinol-phosphatase [Nibricoccus sp. IMCC34717]|uniref:histidinol-phosphatase n=1 Tax=Nibricoccus sp. IMCC34717 TaxID=3034021 RepID=UPI003850DF2B